MTNPDIPQRTRGGLAGKVAGRIKEAAGSVVGNQDLAREGRLQQAQVEAESDAQAAAERARQVESEAELLSARSDNQLELERVQNEIAAREREEAIERDRRDSEVAAQADARREETEADARERLQERGADLAERAAEAERVAAARRTAQLEQEAGAAKATADATYPEERQ